MLDRALPPVPLATLTLSSFGRMETAEQFRSEGRLPLHLEPRPNSDCQYPLKFLRRVVPTVPVAQPVCREEVIQPVASSTPVGKDMVGGPIARYLATTQVAEAGRLRENLSSPDLADLLP